MHSQAHEKPAHLLIETVARRSYGKLLAFVATRTHDLAAAEDALSDAFTAALIDWPRTGCPANPEGWLLTVARRKSIDYHRRRDANAESLDERIEQALSAAVPESDIPDRRLALMFACAHPAIDESICAPLLLQIILGLDAATIASAFLVSPAAMSKRLVRAKEKIRTCRIRFSLPEREELPERLYAVLDAIYAAFAEGWADPAGTDPARRPLTGEAIFLARVVTELMPQEPEPLGLLALMLYAEARRSARRASTGEYVPLPQQNTALWDLTMIAEAEVVLQHASGLGRIGRYQLEAAIQSAHVDRIRNRRPNWDQIIQLYDALFELTQSPVVALNRALAISELHGPEAGLREMPDVSSDARLAGYQAFWAARADLLARVGYHGKARHAYDLAIGLERDASVRLFLQQRQAALHS
ncbi:MAG TPA: DUF6596 domain-containing protein [Bryobacteraceae bacterium]|nr:DUF6596 domain-containing protein [Bryobacteraceae bacterium]